MTDALPAFFAALEASAIGAAVRQSRWIYMIANVGHVVALVLFAAAVAIMDLRMAGVLAATSPGRVLRGARRVAIAAFLGLAVTGAVLFTADASHVAKNTVFQIKGALILLGLLNVAWVEWRVLPRVRELPPLTPLPTAARTGAIASMAIWLAVAICGRAIAYF